MDDPRSLTFHAGDFVWLKDKGGWKGKQDGWKVKVTEATDLGWVTLDDAYTEPVDIVIAVEIPLDDGCDLEETLARRSQELPDAAEPESEQDESEPESEPNADEPESEPDEHEPAKPESEQDESELDDDNQQEGN